MTKPNQQQPQPPAEQERIEVWRERHGELDCWCVRIPANENPLATQHERVALEEVLQGVVDLGGEAEWELRDVGAQDTKQKGGGADERVREEAVLPSDATSGPGMKPLSEDEGRDSSQDSERKQYPIIPDHNTENPAGSPEVTPVDVRGVSLRTWSGVPDSERGEQRREPWRCPICGAAAWYSTAEYPLPGGPALCAHPTPQYERFVPATQADQLRQERDEMTFDEAALDEANRHTADALARRDAAEADLAQLRERVLAFRDALELLHDNALAAHPYTATSHQIALGAAIGNAYSLLTAQVKETDE